MLENGGDPLAPGSDVCQVGCPLAVKAHVAPVRPDDARHDRHEGRFTSSVASNQAKAAPGVQRNAHSAEREGAPELLVDADRFGDGDLPDQGWLLLDLDHD